MAPRHIAQVLPAAHCRPELVEAALVVVVGRRQLGPALSCSPGHVTHQATPDEVGVLTHSLEAERGTVVAEDRRLGYEIID